MSKTVLTENAVRALLQGGARIENSLAHLAGVYAARDDYTDSNPLVVEQEHVERALSECAKWIESGLVSMKAEIMVRNYMRSKFCHERIEPDQGGKEEV